MVIAGTVRVRVGDASILLAENQSVDIPKTTQHRLANPGKVPAEIIEIQSGPFLEEDDIVRLEDAYAAGGGGRRKRRLRRGGHAWGPGNGPCRTDRPKAACGGLSVREFFHLSLTQRVGLA